ncbi:MAG: LON peptidase substrate-binding domain-containing protein [Candidatus Sericytochromatia bacterium]|nr:LON peptidase substrate-binding domain-containing protein [Candidatus Sericytochromatia bacterium]
METVPIFPLDLVVVPGEPVPLHIFEPRYQQLIADCAPAEGDQHYQPFGINYARKTQLHNIGCTVLVDEILHKYPNGEMDIMTYGHRRYRLLDTREEKPYLLGEVEWIVEEPVSPDGVLRSAVLELYDKFLAAVEVDDHTLDRSSEQLSFEIAYRVNLEKLPKLELLEAEHENERLELLHIYLCKTVPEIEKARSFQRRIRSNGYFA